MEENLEMDAPVELSDIQQAALKQSEEELQAFKRELETKKYLVDLKVDDIKSILNYMRTDAPWKFTESLGVLEVVGELTECVKKGKMFMTAISIEALYFYLSKVEGKGMNVDGSIGSLESYLKMLKAINVVRTVILNENEKLKELEFIAASRREGLAPEGDVTPA